MKRNLMAIAVGMALMNEATDGTEGGSGGGVTMETQAGETNNLPAAIEGEHIPAPAEVEVKLPEGAAISFEKLGEDTAHLVVKVGEQAENLIARVREDLKKVLAVNDSGAWATYASGFTLVQAQREAQQKDTRHLKNVKSQVNRILKAAKAQPVTVRDLLNGKLSWGDLQKKLPRQSAAGRPSGSGQQAADAGASINKEIVVDGKVTEVNIQTLIDDIRLVCLKLVEVSKQKNSPYGEYVGRQMLDMHAACLSDYQGQLAEFTRQNGNVMGPEFFEFLGLRETKKAA